MRMRTLAAAALLARAWPVAARAADLGGGTASGSVRGYRDQLTLVTLRTAANGTAVVRATIPARCGVARVTRRDVRIAAGGSFSFTATARDRAPEDARVHRIARVELNGTVNGPVATGTATTRIRLVLHGRTVDKCRSAARAGQARAAVAEPVAGPPLANSPYYGLTDQPVRPHAFMLRVGSGRVQTVAFQYRLPCTDRVVETENLTPGGVIAADGTFRLRERFTVRYANGDERFRVKVAGRFTTAGASGTLSVSSRFGADHCATGVVRWAAAL
jgi:hypothetical protein